MSELIDRRHLILAGAAGLASTACARRPPPDRHPGPGAPDPDRIPVRQRGTIVGNDPADLDRWIRWAGRKPDHVLLALNQTSWDELGRSIDYVVNRAGRGMIARGVKVQWSVPVGGWAKYEDVEQGRQDALYAHAAQTILAVTPRDHGRICVRPPWEFNGDFQSQRARNWKGGWDAELYKASYRRIAGIFRKTSPRFYFDWCPNVGTESFDPEQCYPGDDLVDVVSVDMYYRAKYDDKGQKDAGRSIFEYRLRQPNGLDWLDRLARRHGKLVGLSEWGADDGATAFVAGLADWLTALGPRLSHQNYWDRDEGDAETAISTGRNLAIAAAYRKAFG